MKFKPPYILKHHHHPLYVHVDSEKRNVHKGDDPIRFLVHLLSVSSIKEKSKTL
jgi:hypothetical protein